MYRWVLSHLILFLKTFKFVLDTKHKSCYIIDTTKQGSTYKEEMKMNNKEYREMLINGILEYQTKEQFTKEELDKKSIRTLEIIYDNVD